MNKFVIVAVIVVIVILVGAFLFFSKSSSSLLPKVTNSNNQTTISNNNNNNNADYMYCIGTLGSVTGKEAYYSLLSNSGIKEWNSTTNYPLPIISKSCYVSNNYLYCVGSNLYPYNQSYFAQISSSGIGAWRKTASYPITPGDTSCSVSGGYIYCIGTGAGGTGITGKEAYYANISSSGIGAWKSTTSYPIVFGYGSCSASNGYIYCVGTGYPPDNESYYAPISNTGIGLWKPTTNYFASFTQDSCSIANGYIYCIGTSGPAPSPWDKCTVPYPGSISCSGYPPPYNQSYVASVSSNGIGTWQNATDYPITYGPSIGSCSISNGYIYCTGNLGANGSNQSYFAVVSNNSISTWQNTTKYPIPLTVSGADCSIFNNDVYCVGGGKTPTYKVEYSAKISDSGIGTWQMNGSNANSNMPSCTISITNKYIACLEPSSQQPSTISLNLSNQSIAASLKGITNAINFAVLSYNPSCVVSNNYIYCIGSQNINNSSSVNLTETYYAPLSDGAIGSWSRTTTYPSNVSDLSCATTNNYIYCVGLNPSSKTNEAYYAQLSGNGIGTWQQATNYQNSFIPDYCSVYNSTV